MIREDGTHLVSGGRRCDWGGRDTSGVWGDSVIREDGTHLVFGETVIREDGTHLVSGGRRCD